jgi:trehalose synthase
MPTLDEYKTIIGEDAVDRIRKQARPLNKKTLAMFNSTNQGGGVAEILSSLVLLLNDCGVQTHWRLIKAKNDFFHVTKKMHNMLQGQEGTLTSEDQEVYARTIRTNLSFTHFDYDAVIIHDPQPCMLVEHGKKKGQPWVWRCHIDLSNPNSDAWHFLKPMVERYDRVIVSKEEYKQHIKTPQVVIPPAIDPLSEKNRAMDEEAAKQRLRLWNIDPERPIISQVSRFDKWKNPLGVIETFKEVKKRTDCQLVLLGSAASDDPEGAAMYNQVVQAAKGEKDIHVINFESDLLVNALQRQSAVVLQLSLKEGFALTVSEALWKGTPVVASDVGGIGLQVRDGVDGYLVDSPQTAAERVYRLLVDGEVRARMGEAGKELVRERFLITRLLEDYLKLLNELLAQKVLAKNPS